MTTRTLAVVGALLLAHARSVGAQDASPCALPANAAVASVGSAGFPPGVGRARLENPADRKLLDDAIARAFGTPAEPRVPVGVPVDAALAFGAGRKVYGERCSACHGASGAGDGPAGRPADPPRDFRRGVFKFTSTDVSSVAAPDDLVRTIQRWIPPESSPGEDSLRAAIEYVRFLAIRGYAERRLAATIEYDGELSEEAVRDRLTQVGQEWATAAERVVKLASPAPPSSDAAVARGRALFVSKRAQCVDCHGKEGRGGGKVAPEDIKDEWGKPARTLDLAIRPMRCGGSPEDAYRVIACGVKGAVMPAFEKALSADEVWDLVHFVRSLETSK